MNKIPVTYLGPVGATFSDVAYHRLTRCYVAPFGDEADYLPVSSNAEVVGEVIRHGGYGAIAVETLAQGRVSEPFEAFVELLGKYNHSSCPMSVIGALKMRLSFCLMVRRGVAIKNVQGILAHTKSFGACKKNVANLGLAIREVSSNGEAARLIAEDENYESWAALGPESAGEKYGLEIVEKKMEDSIAVTTFFLLGPRGASVSVGKKNRVLIVFRVKHVPGALLKALKPWDEYGFNLSHLHSVHVENGSYDFATEVEVEEDKISSFYQALGMFREEVNSFISFGPFQVIC